MTAAQPSQLREAAVINFVYGLSQAVRRLKDGGAVGQRELSRLVSRLDDMGREVLELEPRYPDLPAIFERMRLRLEVLTCALDCKRVAELSARPFC